MRLNTIILIIKTFLIFSCGNKKTGKITYYKTLHGKIITAEAYDSIKTKLNEQGEPVKELIITSTEEKGDSIIKSFLIGIVPTHSEGNNFNPFDNAEKFIGKKLPFNSLTSIEGELLNTDDLKGKPTLINFWFIKCPPCVVEIPELNAIKEHYGNSVNFLAITFDPKEEVSVFLKKMKFDFIQVTDAKDEIAKIGNDAYPMTMFLDKNGVVRFVRGNVTEKDGKDFKMIIDKLL